MSIPQEWLQYAPKPKDIDPGDWHVFLSYRSVNRSWVLNLYDVLRELGYKVFIDQCELVAGENLVVRLDNALSRSRAGVLIWSKAAVDSEWVSQEYQTLLNKSIEDKGFKFVPVNLDGTKLPGFAANKIFVDFSSYPDGPNGGELLLLLHGIAGQAPNSQEVRFANQQSEATKDAAYDIEAAVKVKDADELVQLFEKGGLAWQTSASLGCKAAESLIKLGKNKEAIEILEKVKAQFPKSIRPKQLHALALARRGGNGDLKEAQKILAKLYAQGERDPETLGIFARTWMDRYKVSNDISDLEQSRDYYAEAFDRAPDDYYTGVNAAAKSFFIGSNEAIAKGIEYAKKVEDDLGNKAYQGDYWKTATVGEILLMQKKYAEAGGMYEEAVKMAKTETASHNTTLKQARLLMDNLKPSPEQKAQVLAAFSHLFGSHKE